MAVASLCDQLKSGQDLACLDNLNRKYFQQVVVINKTDIDPSSVEYVKQTTPAGDCAYGVKFTLLTSKAGFMFKGNERGSNYSGVTNKTTSDFGMPNYIHNVSMLLAGADEETKCRLAALDKGSYVVAIQFTDGSVEIYGMGNGLSTGDYDIDLQANGGIIPLTLSSNEDTPEFRLPSIYVSEPAGQENEDFNSLFASA